MITAATTTEKHLNPITPINVAYLQHELHNHPNVSFVSKLVQGFRDGFSIGFEGPRMPCFSHNLKSADEHPDVVTKNLLKEVCLCRTAGPFLSPPFQNLQIYPIGVVPKKHSPEWRTIFHRTQKHLTIALTRTSQKKASQIDAINLIIQLGHGSYMAKTDICSARSS